MKKSICYVSDAYWPSSGGVEEAVRQCAALLPDRFDLSIVTPASKPLTGSLYRRTALAAAASPYRDPDCHAVLPLRPTRFQLLLLLPYLLWNLPLLRRSQASRLYDRLYAAYRAVFFETLKKHLAGADLVHCFSTSHLARLTTDVCADLNIPLIHSPYIHFGRWGDSPAQREAYSRADAVICPTDHFRQQFLSFAGATAVEATVIPPIVGDLSGADEKPVPAVAGLPFVLFLGRREKHKGLALLREAFRRVTAPARLVIAGSGALPGEVGDRVMDLGAIDDATRRWLLAHCDCFCMPSEDETFGIVYAEAMSCGKPVVALHTPPLPEIVEHGVTGLLTPPGDAALLAESLDSLLRDAPLRSRMGAAGRVRFEKLFAGEVSMRKMVVVYDRLMVDAKNHTFSCPSSS